MNPQNLLPRHPWQMSPHRASSSPMHLRQGHGSGQASHRVIIDRARSRGFRRIAPRAVPSPGELLPLRVLLSVLLATTQIPPGTSGAFRGETRLRARRVPCGLTPEYLDPEARVRIQ